MRRALRYALRVAALALFAGTWFSLWCYPLAHVALYADAWLSPPAPQPATLKHFDAAMFGLAFACTWLVPLLSAWFILAELAVLAAWGAVVIYEAEKLIGPERRVRAMLRRGMRYRGNPRNN